MSDKLSFKQDDFYNLILNKIIDLETDLLLNNSMLAASFQHLKSDSKKEYDAMTSAVKEQRPDVRKEFALILVAQLKGMSNDMDDFLEKLID